MKPLHSFARHLILPAAVSLLTISSPARPNYSTASGYSVTYLDLMPAGKLSFSQADFSHNIAVRDRQDRQRQLL
jgi:hypothetical protein